MGELEFIRSSHITNIDLQSIYEIEQDLWARFFGEYIVCEACGKIQSKQDVYKEKNLSHFGLDIKKNTVAEIEKIIGGKYLDCPDCYELSSHVFGKEYMQEMKMQFDFQESFLSIQRGVCGKILGFVTSYISDFDTIYEREFAYYYRAIGKKDIKLRLEAILEEQLPKKILCFSAIGNSPETATTRNLYELFKHMFIHIETQSPDLLGLYETVLKSMTHALLETCNTKRIKIKNQDRLNVNSKIESDIFLHKNMAQACLHSLGENYKQYVKLNSKKLRETME